MVISKQVISNPIFVQILLFRLKTIQHVGDDLR